MSATKKKFSLLFNERLPFAGVRKTKIWDVCADKLRLGEIRWWSHWRRYCFYPNDDTLYDAACLEQITWFIQREMEARKAK